MPLFHSGGIRAAPGWPSFPPFLAAYLEEGGLAAEWRLALGLEARAAVAHAPLSVDSLTREELACYRNLPDTSRRAWLTGRAALRRLQRRFDPFPVPGAPGLAGMAFSLAYSAGTAVAAACLDAPGTGLGIDLDSDPALAPGTAGHFLAREELEEISARLIDPAGAEAGSHWLRLRTVKKALFRADPDRRGRGLRDYRVLGPALRRGRARLRPGLEPRGFRYVSHAFAGWRLTLAAAPPLFA